MVADIGPAHIIGDYEYDVWLALLAASGECGHQRRPGAGDCGSQKLAAIQVLPMRHDLAPLSASFLCGCFSALNFYFGIIHFLDIRASLRYCAQPEVTGGVLAAPDGNVNRTEVFRN